MALAKPPISGTNPASPASDETRSRTGGCPCLARSSLSRWLRDSTRSRSVWLACSSMAKFCADGVAASTHSERERRVPGAADFTACTTITYTIFPTVGKPRNSVLFQRLPKAGAVFGPHNFRRIPQTTVQDRFAETPTHNRSSVKSL